LIVPGTFPGRRQVRDPIAGANILAVQRLLGHDTATMTLDTYGHLFSDDLTKVAKSLDKAAGASLSE
jgi:integrase